MNLLALNLQRSSAISSAVYGEIFDLFLLTYRLKNNWCVLSGNFSGPKQQEFVVAKGGFLELLRPDDTGKIISICSTPVFSIIRSILPFRLSGNFCELV
jgi:hypothetical protein